MELEMEVECWWNGVGVECCKRWEVCKGVNGKTGLDVTIGLDSNVLGSVANMATKNSRMKQ